MRPVRFVSLLILGVVLCSLPIGLVAYSQDKPLRPQDTLPKKEDRKEKDVPKIEEKVKDKVNDKVRPSVTLSIDVPRDCKIAVNDKPVTYEKFEVLMEFASSAFTIEDMAYRSGQFTAIKLKSKE